MASCAVPPTDGALSEERQRERERNFFGREEKEREGVCRIFMCDLRLSLVLYLSPLGVADETDGHDDGDDDEGGEDQTADADPGPVELARLGDRLWNRGGGGK